MSFGSYAISQVPCNLPILVPSLTAEGSCFLSVKFPKKSDSPILSFWTRLKQSMVGLWFTCHWTGCGLMSHGPKWEWKLQALEVVDMGVYLQEVRVGKYWNTGPILYKFICRSVCALVHSPICTEHIISSFICLDNSLSIVWEQSTYWRYLDACVSSEFNLGLEPLKSYCQVKEQTNKKSLMHIYCLETKGGLHIGLWYHKWHDIMLSICLSSPLCSNLPSGILAHTKEQMKIKSISLPTHS